MKQLSKLKVTLLLMAAGGSRRMGETIKQLLPWKGTTLINNAVDIALQTNVQQVKVVLGAHVAQIKKEVPAALECYECKDWEKGLGTSIFCGVQNIIDSSDKPDKILIMLADHPFITADFLDLMIATAANSPKLIVATRYGEKAGVPAIFDKTLFEELAALEGDTGARGIIEKYRESTTLLQNEDAEKDVDTLEDYELLSRK